MQELFKVKSKKAKVKKPFNLTFDFDEAISYLSPFYFLLFTRFRLTLLFGKSIFSVCRAARVI
jgi:hypothetical protein